MSNNSILSSSSISNSNSSGNKNDSNNLTLFNISEFGSKNNTIIFGNTNNKDSKNSSKLAKKIWFLFFFFLLFLMYTNIWWIVKFKKKKRAVNIPHIFFLCYCFCYRLQHPNIIQLYGTYDEKDYVYLVMELVTGGELFDRIVAKVIIN